MEGGSKVNTDQGETRASSRLPDVRPRVSVEDWGGLQFRRCSIQFERGPAQKKSMVTAIPTSAIGHHQPSSLILLPCLPPGEASHWSNLPLSVGVTIWRNQFRETIQVSVPHSPPSLPCSEMKAGK